MTPARMTRTATAKSICDSDDDNDGIPDECDVDATGGNDCDQDGQDDSCQDDSDGDGEIDACDSDDDGDGIPDECDVDRHWMAMTAIRMGKMTLTMKIPTVTAPLILRYR